ncbi:hypothetical protein E2562_014902 [Oryza meyeriana var. granulata]|uniref:Uncharacterized protein n=1 Tax=Oryza meyeriana var. granulata TaxID=110450 RepID=A0A6G1EJM4_9ORYZ|nr:hypothetical protein E2562_014902 [Oryza meyeriana var. granulata]
MVRERWVAGKPMASEEGDGAMAARVAFFVGGRRGERRQRPAASREQLTWAHTNCSTEGRAGFGRRRWQK